MATRFQNIMNTNALFRFILLTLNTSHNKTNFMKSYNNGCVRRPPIIIVTLARFLVSSWLMIWIGQTCKNSQL